jgi:hypothetical protein
MRQSSKTLSALTSKFAVMALVVTLSLGTAAAEDHSFIKNSNKVATIASTVPPNGDVNPYGIARVPETVGALHEGNFLISNFNNGANSQGTGTTIVQISPHGAMSVFAQIDDSTLPGSCPGGIGLTTALSVLRSGWVIVGSLPTSDGSSATAMAGCLLVLNSSGKVVETIAGWNINGPWDMTALDAGDFAELFVTNVLNDTVAQSPNVVNTGSVVRLLLHTPRHGMPTVVNSTVIGWGFPARTDPGALVIGPTGLALDLRRDVLYVADSLNNRIAAISHPIFRQSSAGVGSTVTMDGMLNDPLGVALAPNGNILVANGDDGNIIEFTPNGKQVAIKLVDNTGGPPPGGGTLFGLIAVEDKGVYFVDDGSNTLNLLSVRGDHDK